MAKGRKTGGRQPGSPNQITRELRDMIEGALAAAGGQDYLLAQAHANPKAFLLLVGKLLPRDVTVRKVGMEGMQEMTEAEIMARLAQLRAERGEGMH